MSKFKIEDIKKEVESNDWELLSTSYKNLDSDLEFKCPENHLVTLSYRKWRMTHTCPICENNPFKQLPKMPRKTSKNKRVLAIDQASSTSGYSLFDGDQLIKYGKVTMHQATSVERVEGVKQWLINLIDNFKPDLVAIEDIHFQERPGETLIAGIKTFKLLAQLQGVLINYLYNINMPYDIVNVAQWREFNQVKGKTRTDKKRSAQLVVKNTYDISVTQDEADAICIGRFVANKFINKVKMIDW